MKVAVVIDLRAKVVAVVITVGFIIIMVIVSVIRTTVVRLSHHGSKVT